MSEPPTKKPKVSDFTLESLAIDSPSTSAGNKICCDNVSARRIKDCLVAMMSINIRKPFNDKIPFSEQETCYSNFLGAELDDLLRQMRPKWAWTATGKLSGKDVGRFRAKIGNKACTLRVVREAKFGKQFCANFVRYTSEIGESDITLEVFEPLTDEPGDWTSTQSNAVACIEVKQALTLNDRERNKGLQQLVSYLVTKVRPIALEQTGRSWLLHGLLMARAEGYLIVLRSNEWLDYPWECSRITRFVFNEYISGVRELLRRYVSVALDPQTTNGAQLFKRPIELTFPKYPDNVERLSKNANVIKCKWSVVMDHFPQDAMDANLKCPFSKLPLPGDSDVVLKIVSPTIYKHDDEPGKTGQIVSDLEKLVLAIDKALRRAWVSNEAKQRLSTVDQLYLHVGFRGKCRSSRLVVTAFRGQPICAVKQLTKAWNVKFRKRFFDQVCLTVFDVVSLVGYAHTDLRPANIVFDGRHFTIIDWESVRSIGSDQTAVSGKAKTKIADEDEGDAQQNEMDERYPDVQADEDAVRWLVFSAFQLYMCVYIIDTAAKGGSAKDVEKEFRRGGGFWQASRLQWPDAVKSFPTWREERRFGDLLKAANEAKVAVCRSGLEGILRCALKIE